MAASRGVVTLVLIARAHGLTSANVISDIGAGVPGRWQLWQERCMIGSTSFVNVGGGARGAGAWATGWAENRSAGLQAAALGDAGKSRDGEPV